MTRPRNMTAKEFAAKKFVFCFGYSWERMSPTISASGKAALIDALWYPISQLRIHTDDDGKESVVCAEWLFYEKEKEGGGSRKYYNVA